MCDAGLPAASGDHRDPGGAAASPFAASLPMTPRTPITMQINISGRHFTLTPANEEYARKKADRLLRFFDRIQQIDIVVDKTKEGFHVEIVTDVEHHKPFVCTSTNHDLYASIDLGIDKAQRQLTDHKSKLRDNKHPHTSGSRPNETA